MEDAAAAETQTNGAAPAPAPEVKRAKNAAEYLANQADGVTESKRHKFERIASKRTKTVIRSIRNLSKLGGANAYNYEFTQADVDKIRAAFIAEIDKMGLSMLPPARQLDVEFDFG